MLLLLAPAVILLGATAAQEKHPQEPEPSAAVFRADPPPEVQDPAQQRRLESLYEGALLGAVDAQDFAEIPGYRRLLEILARYSEEDLRARAGRRLDVAASLADPDGWRGEIVRVRALLVDLRYVRLASPLGERVDVVRALLTQPDGSEGVFVDFLEPPSPELELEEDVVEVEGVFFRTVRYENRKDELVEAPYLIARSLRRLDTEALQRSTTFDGMAKILIGLAVAFLVIRILLTMRKTPAGRQFAGADGGPRSLRERARIPLPPVPPATKS